MKEGNEVVRVRGRLVLKKGGWEGEGGWYAPQQYTHTKSFLLTHSLTQRAADGIRGEEEEQFLFSFTDDEEEEKGMEEGGADSEGEGEEGGEEEGEKVEEERGEEVAKEEQGSAATER